MGRFGKCLDELGFKYVISPFGADQTEIALSTNA